MIFLFGGLVWVIIHSDEVKVFILIPEVSGYSWILQMQATLQGSKNRMFSSVILIYFCPDAKCSESCYFFWSSRPLKWWARPRRTFWRSIRGRRQFLFQRQLRRPKRHTTRRRPCLSRHLSCWQLRQLICHKSFSYCCRFESFDRSDQGLKI